MDMFSMMEDMLAVADDNCGVVPTAVSAKDTHEQAIIDIDIMDKIAEVMLLRAPVVAVNDIAADVNVLVDDFDDEHNILNPDVRDRFRSECVYDETELFTTPINTTNTMEGYLSNVQFHEEKLIQDVVADENVVIYRCNYGKVVYDGYTEPVPKKKTNRGRKKKEKKKKPRKKQGDGTDFNSQITLVVRSSLAPPEEDIDGMLIVRDSTRVYKFKIFRTGEIQLPGMHQNNTDDVIVCARLVASVLNGYLHSGEQDITKTTRIINMNPVMKNYKFVIKLENNKIIDLDDLYNTLVREQLSQFRRRIGLDTDVDPAPAHPPIFMIKYEPGETKLSIKFSTPIRNKPDKCTRINIFMRGKVNILGAFDVAVTRQICDYIHWIFTAFPRLMVEEGCGGLRQRELLPANISCEYDGMDVVEIIAAQRSEAEYRINSYIGDISELLEEFAWEQREKVIAMDAFVDSLEADLA